MAPKPTPVGRDVDLHNDKIGDAFAAQTLGDLVLGQSDKVSNIAMVQDEKSGDDAMPHGQQVACTALAILPKRVRTISCRKRVLESLRTKTLESATEEFEQRKEVAEATLCDVQAEEEVLAQQATEALAEFKSVQIEVDASIAKEIEAAKEFKVLTSKRGKHVEDARKELYEAQKKLAYLEVMAVNSAKIKALDEAHKQAQKDAALAKKSMVEEKQREKEAVQAIQRAMADTRIEAMKPFAKGKRSAKRGLEDSVTCVQEDGPKKHKTCEDQLDADCANKLASECEAKEDDSPTPDAVEEGVAGDADTAEADEGHDAQEADADVVNDADDAEEGDEVEADEGGDVD